MFGDNLTRSQTEPLIALDGVIGRSVTVRNKREANRLLSFVSDVNGRVAQGPVRAKKPPQSPTSAALLTLKEKGWRRKREQEGLEEEGRGSGEAETGCRGSCFCVYDERSPGFEGNPERCSRASGVLGAG